SPAKIYQFTPDPIGVARNADGVWGELVNLGGRVNSDQNDRCPAFSPNFKTFFFDSERSGGFGDKDLWSLPYSAIEDIR
ncbi:MAG: hypothetical protein P8P42_06670, partial [Gammaproteobacteria bacterium]|nr:hypothetical protein [Gammaproteobacteria bacterium]